MTKIKGVYMKRTLGLFCFAFCSLSMISCASAPDTIPPELEGMRVAMPIVELLATVGMVSGFGWGLWGKDRAVDNYNLYIQGIPVK